MNGDNGIIQHNKGFFVLHHYYLIRYFNILFISIILGAICGFTMVLFGVLFYPENPQLFILLGITALLGAALKSPIAVIFIIIELTWVPFLIISVSITTLIAYIFSGPNSIIPGQKTLTEKK